MITPKDIETTVWTTLRKLDTEVRDTVHERVGSFYKTLPMGISTPSKLRRLEQFFIGKVLDDVLQLILESCYKLDEKLELAAMQWDNLAANSNGKNKLETSRKAKEVRCQKLEVRLVVAHCRGLTLGEGNEDAFEHTSPARNISHYTRIYPHLSAVPELVTGNTSDLSVYARTDLYHYIFHKLYCKLFNEENTLNRLMLTRAPKKRRMEVHLGCSPDEFHDNKLSVTKSEMDSLFPTELLHNVEQRAGTYFNDWLAQFERASVSSLACLSKSQINKFLSERLDQDKDIQKWRTDLSTYRQENSTIGKMAQARLGDALGRTPWVTDTEALEAVQALGSYRRLGGEHFYTFPTSAADAIDESGLSLEPSSLVLMTSRHLPVSIQFFFSSLAQAVFEAKEALTVGLLHEEASVMMLFNAAMHQMDKQLLRLQAELSIADVNPNTTALVEQFKTYLTQSIRLVNTLQQRHSLKECEVNLLTLIEAARSYTGLDEADIQVHTSKLQVTNLKGDEMFLFLMFYNLFDNAKKCIVDNAKRHNYSRDISVESEIVCEQNSIIIKVINGGKGISKELADAFFQPKTDQTGLGRFICLWVAELHGGSIEIDKSFCEIGTQTCFKITFPAARVLRV